MIRNYKVFGLAVVAMLAFGAFMAQGASAVPLTCESGSGTCYTTGDQNGETHKFTTAGGSITCTEAVFTGSGAVAGGAVNEQTVTPSYPTTTIGGASNCTAFGFAGAHINNNGCTYTFTTPVSIGVGEVTWTPNGTVDPSGENTGSPHLVCPTGKSIEITPTFFGASVCTQFVGAQTPTGGHVVGKNVAGSSPMDIKLEITLKEIHYTGTGSSCGNSETHTDATLTGNSTVKCYSDSTHKTQVGCTFS